VRELSLLQHKSVAEVITDRVSGIVVAVAAVREVSTMNSSAVRAKVEALSLSEIKSEHSDGVMRPVRGLRFSQE
jgi:hypothetical protein